MDLVASPKNIFICQPLDIQGKDCWGLGWRDPQEYTKENFLLPHEVWLAWMSSPDAPWDEFQYILPTWRSDKNHPYPPKKWTSPPDVWHIWVDDFPKLPQVGYVNFLEGIHVGKYLVRPMHRSPGDRLVVVVGILRSSESPCGGLLLCHRLDDAAGWWNHQ